MKTKRILIALLLAQIPVREIVASGPGTIAGLTLLEAPTARASALGESLVAGSNDISALGYNPASLATMKTGQASFLYQKGLVDDSYGHFMIGAPSRHGGVGLSIGYYNGGKLDATSGSGSVTAQSDLALSLAFARQMGPVSFGTTAKYLSSEIAETARATAYAADFGLSVAVGNALRFGAALQNVGTQLKYVDSGDDLPRMARLGAAYSFRPMGMTTSLMFDGTYRMVEKEFQPAAGVEVAFGVMALRAGYRGGSNKEITVGTGFFMGRSSLDYSFGMNTAELDASHRISYSLRFGGRSSIASQLAAVPAAQRAVPPVVLAQTPTVVKEATPEEISSTAPAAEAQATPAHNVVETTPMAMMRRVAHAYEVKPGDSLASIARVEYGDARLWRRIYQANSHLLTSPTEIEPGIKIVLP